MHETVSSVSNPRRIEVLDEICRRAGLTLAVMVCLVGATVLVGWATGIAALKGDIVNGITVKANAGVCFFLAGTSLALWIARGGAWNRSSLPPALAIVVVVISTMVFSQHLFKWDLGIDQFLFVEEPGQRATASPNRMGPPACIAFILSGLSLLLLTRRRSDGGRGEDRASRLAIIVCLIAALPTLGYLLGADQLYGIAALTGISLVTAVTFLLLGIGILLSCRRGQLVNLLTSENAGGLLIRRLLLPSLLLPPLLECLRTVGENAGYYNAPFGRSLLVLAFIVCFSGLVWWSSKILESTDEARRRGQREREQILAAERFARAEAERLNHIKDEFLATLSHELRTPLTAILGWSHLLKDARAGSENFKLGLETIDRNARVQTQLIEDLLDMSRIISGKLRLEILQIYPAAALEAAIDTSRPAADAKGVRLETLLDPHCGPVSVDPNRLQQIVWNLLSNAIKFTPRGGKVQIALQRINSHIEFSVSDTGQGIAPDFLPFVFDRFRQADASTTRKAGGLGLGLAITKQLVDLHGGNVRVASDGEGKGTVFTVSLPLTAVNVRTPDSMLAHSSVATATHPDCRKANLRGIRVLLVDDEDDSREILKRVLCECDAEVTTSASGADALIVLRSYRPDVLISDIGMPGMDGYDFLRHVRALDGAAGHVPAIALTAFARSEDRTRALSVGYAVHVVKPVEPSELVVTVASVVGRAHDVAPLAPDKPA
ncbi:MAG: response regulator [Burkholderiales bacterium]|nr:response regulator [Phycisphaerae bacterium]